MELYGTELLWYGQKGWCKNCQRLVNKLERMITDMLKSVPVGVVVQEAGLLPAVSLQNNRHRRYYLKLLAAKRTQGARYILSVTIREREEQA